MEPELLCPKFKTAIQKNRLDSRPFMEQMKVVLEKVNDAFEASGISKRFDVNIIDSRGAFMASGAVLKEHTVAFKDLDSGVESSRFYVATQISLEEKISYRITNGRNPLTEATLIKEGRWDDYKDYAVMIRSGRYFRNDDEIVIEKKSSKNPQELCQRFLDYMREMLDENEWSVMRGAVQSFSAPKGKTAEPSPPYGKIG